MNDIFFALIGALASSCSILAFFLGRRTAAKKADRDAGKKEATTDDSISYIKNRVEDILIEQKETNNRLSAYAERLARVEESAKQAHKRLDAITKERN